LVCEELIVEGLRSGIVDTTTHVVFDTVKGTHTSDIWSEASQCAQKTQMEEPELKKKERRTIRFRDDTANAR
jgi:hypothetical protein